MASQVAEQYGQALFELAKEENALERWQKQAKEIIVCFQENPELHDFFRAVKISVQEKKQLIDQVFRDRLDPMMIHFLDLLLDKKRIRSAAEILQWFVVLANDEQGIQMGTVYSARKLSGEEVARLEEAMSGYFHKRTELTNRIDKKLISGVKVVVGNEVLDDSLQGKIEQMKNELLKESR